ncbi:BTB/POZ domain-containing protein 18 [Labeo rohita]|uniref:BTB/POZ domain-containing protein 18 n=1 Tax=Labeo rohita TaxID=84645 RepID=A0ABQ8MZZ7_LABRO|nr:BTB/POZ domain-containing protein 18 [Labeo rohita]
MWQYQHPDFALFLLGELQKQQQGSIFCDTLLQTDAHSCVLAALSPVLSRVLSTSPAPHPGQNRLLNLETVGSRVLLKLVRFLYTGEMEIKSQSEHEELMAAAFRLGLKNLFEKKRACVDVGRRWREIGVQTEDVITRESELVSKPLRSQSSTLPVHSVQPCGLLESNLASLSLFDEDSLTRGFNRTSSVAVPSHAVLTEASVSNHHKTKAKRWKMAKRESQLKKLTLQQMNVSGKNFRKLLETDKRQKSATAEQKEAQVDQLKVKIKLRRSGACWESDLLVSVQGESEKKPEEVNECGLQTQSGPPHALPAQSLGTLTPPTDLPISPSNSSTHASSDKCPHTPHNISVSSPLDVPALSSSPPQADESDEHIARMLDDMLKGLNILPLMPIDRNLDEQDQLGPLQDPKSGQRTAEMSAQGACLYVQSCEPEMSESDVSKTAVPVGSPGIRDKDHSGFQNQSGCNTFELLTQSPGQDNSNKDNNLATLARNSTPSLVEDMFLTPKVTAVQSSPATGKMPSLDMTSILDERPDFKLLRCLSPLESDKGDSDVPIHEPSQRQDLESQNLPMWLSESPLKLDFPLNSMIDSSYPHPQPDLIACQNQSCPDLAENQELNTSFLHNDLMSGSSSNTIQHDVNDASEQPNQRKTRRRRLATRKSKMKVDTECQNLENQDQVQLCDDPHCENVKPSTIARRVSTRITNANRKATAGVKRKSEISSPISKKMPQLDTASKQHEDALPKPKLTGLVKRGRGRRKDVLPKPKDTGVVKRGRGRPPRSNPNLPTLGQDDCEVKIMKTDSEIEQGNEQQPNTQQEKDSTEMEAADVNSNFAQTALNSHLKYAGQAKGPSILDQIFHQTLPSAESLACRSSPNIDQQLTSSLRDTSSRLQKFLGGKSENENGKLVMNSSELINTDICGKKKVETSMLISENKDMEISDDQVVASLLSCGDMPDNVKCSVREIATEENSSTQSTVLQNSDSQKDIQDQTAEISVPLTSEEDIMKETMMSADDIGHADHAMSPTKKDCVVSTNEPRVMEGNEMNFCMNPDSTPAEHLRSSEATVSDECSFEASSDMDKEVQAEHDVSCVADCLEKKDDSCRNQEGQMIEKTMEEKETEVLRANEFVEENALLASNDGCWESTNGRDDNDKIDVEEEQYCAEMTDGQTPLEEDELSKGLQIAVDASNNALRNTEEIISRDAPSVQTEESLQSNDQSEDISTVMCNSDSGDEEDIEVDVVEESVEDPLELLAARQVVILLIEDLMDQEDELDGTEEEEVDVTGEETE